MASLMGLNKATTLSCRVESTIFEVPDKGFYMILSATQYESYDSLRMVKGKGQGFLLALSISHCA
jgi:hypothetical protein